MKKTKSLIAFAAVVGMAVSTAMPAVGNAAVSTTTLKATVSAQGVAVDTAAWNVNKTASTNEINLTSRDTYTLTWQTDVQKTVTAERAVKGNACVTNTGVAPTRGLLVKVNGALVDTAAKPVLNPGQAYCYGYRVPTAVALGSEATVKVNASIMNYTGYNGVRHGVSAANRTVMPTPRQEGYASVSVNDHGVVTELSDSASWQQQQTVSCPSEAQISQAAFIVQTGQTSVATVAVNCNPVNVTSGAVVITPMDDGNGYSVTGTVYISASATADVPLAGVTATFGDRHIPLACPSLVVPAGGSLACTYDLGRVTEDGVLYVTVARERQHYGDQVVDPSDLEYTTYAIEIRLVD